MHGDEAGKPIAVRLFDNTGRHRSKSILADIRARYASTKTSWPHTHLVAMLHASLLCSAPAYAAAHAITSDYIPLCSFGSVVAS